MENQIRCNHCTKSFKSPTALRGHMRIHRQKKQSSGGGGGVASSSSFSSYNPNNEASETTMAMVEVMDVVPLATWKVDGPSSHNNNVAARNHNTNEQLSLGRGRYVCVDCNMSFKSHHALGGHRSWKHSPKRLQILLPAPNQSLLVRRSQRLRLFGVNLDVPIASS